MRLWKRHESPSLLRSIFTGTKAPPPLIIQCSYSPVFLFNKHFVEFAVSIHHGFLFIWCEWSWQVSFACAVVCSWIYINKQETLLKSYKSFILISHHVTTGRGVSRKCTDLVPHFDSSQILLMNRGSFFRRTVVMCHQKWNRRTKVDLWNKVVNRGTRSGSVLRCLLSSYYNTLFSSCGTLCISGFFAPLNSPNIGETTRVPHFQS